MWGVYFHMGAYKHDEVVVIKMGVYSWGAYFVWAGAYYPNLQQNYTHNCSYRLLLSCI